jgi:hypothetical protein
MEQTLMEEIRISGKDLGALAKPDFCPRCFWIQRKAPAGLPYQIFPGIFSSIDSYSKNIVHTWFDRHGAPPVWLKPLGDIIGYIAPPHFSKFNFVDRITGIRLTGAPDAILIKRDKSLTIADYKTAKFTMTQDLMLPVYEIQLNAYALIAKEINFGDVTDLALIYTEPVTDKSVADSDTVHTADGFEMGFSAKILKIKLDLSSIPPLLKSTQEILSQKNPPYGRAGCENCQKINGMLDILKVQ